MYVHHAATAHIVQTDTALAAGLTTLPVPTGATSTGAYLEDRIVRATYECCALAVGCQANWAEVNVTIEQEILAEDRHTAGTSE